jgi:protein OS-9
MNLPPTKYLCSIPVLEDYSPENRTATELAKAEEQRELARASEKGWELLKDMNGDCLHFMSGWWSYRFCYGKDIVQYHALPSVPNGLPPVQDPQTAHYILGKVPNTPSTSGQVQSATQEQTRPPNTDLQVKGDQRYLVQRLDDGTVCDLTGRERTIEVQYHCVPTMVNDRIAWIKEVTTCAYLMVVHTPRLCADVAFLPPQPMTANPITCHPIVPNEKIGSGEEGVDVELPRAGDPLVKDREGRVLNIGDPRHPPVIGGIVVGGQNILAADGEGASAVTLEAPHRYMPGKQPTVVVVASRASKEEGGLTERLDKDALHNLGVDSALIDETVMKLEDMAGDAGWKIEVVDEPGRPRELRAFVDVDEEAEAEDAKNGKKSEEGRGEEEGSEEGSEERFFHEEL